MAVYDFDLFVIGGGSAGVRAARVAASLGASVAVAEERYLGGTCVNVGCVPKKLLSYAAHYRDDFADSAGFGWRIGGSGDADKGDGGDADKGGSKNDSEVAFDWPTLIANKDKEISRLNRVYQSLLENSEVKIFRERARLAGGGMVEVGGEGGDGGGGSNGGSGKSRRFKARYILIAVGGWPWVPDFPGREHAITSNEVFHLPRLPQSLLVLGGGYIAVEFASIFTRLGSEVSLVYRGDALLRGFDGDVRRFLSGHVGRHLNLMLNQDIVKITKKNNNLQVQLKSGQSIPCEAVLAATGRRPLTADLGLERTAIKPAANGAIPVDGQFRTTEAGVYAAGDVIDRVALTPVALAEGQIIARRLFDKSGREMDYENIPSAVFCHPNVGTVGLSEEAAEAAGHKVKVFAAEVGQLKHSLSGRDEKVLLKLVVDRVSDQVLGLHIVGPEAGELVQGFAVAMNCGATKADFDRTVGIHPTLAEEFVTLRDARE